MEVLKNVKNLFLLTLAVSVVGCGVKGMPVPPTTPPPLGRGEPTYKEVNIKKEDNSKNKKTNQNRAQ